MRLFFALLAVVGCSSHSDPPTSCDPNERMGTFLFHYVTVSGNCGSIPDQLVNTTTSSTMQTQQGCTVASSVLSDGNCKLSDVVQCPPRSSLGNATITEVSSQTDASGNVFSGTASFVVAAGCAGTYSFTATRQ